MKVDKSAAGCWIDGHWGQYAMSYAILIASEHGYEGEVVEVAERHMDECYHPGTDNGISPDEHEWVSDSSDAIDAWMTENVAPEGYSFGWYDGEWFLMSSDEWEEAE
jgi:hypothetical protein